MAKLIDNLTEKERVTLRLIVRGHDAKAAASELGLSVHTINERLRSARRKLSVTSSKEAARLLLESVEGTPETLVDEGFGGASTAHIADHPNPSARNTRALWIGGVLIMLVLTFASALALSGSDLAHVDSSTADLTSTSSQDGITAKLAEPDVEAETAARRWLALVDAFDWQASFAAAGQSFQSLNEVPGWQAASEQVRVPLGTVVKREAIASETIAAPPHGYTLVRFMTTFDSGKVAIESVTLERDDDSLKVVGYLLD